jgi:PIN domain nuclease of toxin-antitoxin system
MKVLLDTHVFLWLQTQPERLGAQLPVVEDEQNELLVSAATAWEIAIKFSLGRLPLPLPPARFVPDRIRSIGATTAPLAHDHVLGVSDLPPIHWDPFDRVLVAQSTALEATLLTADATVHSYPGSSLLID